MTHSDIPKRVRDLISRDLSSVEQLELLFLLRQLQPQELSAEEASRRLHTSQHSSRTRLEELVRTGHVAVRAERYRYAASGEADRAVAELERYYGTHRTRIISLIFSRPSESVRDFADAFRLRKDR